MGNGKNKKKQAPKNPRSRQKNFAGVSTPKQNPIHPHTHSVARIQHTHSGPLATSIIPNDEELQGVVNQPNFHSNATIFDLQDLEQTATCAVPCNTPLWLHTCNTPLWLHTCKQMWFGEVMVV